MQPKDGKIYNQMTFRTILPLYLKEEAAAFNLLPELPFSQNPLKMKLNVQPPGSAGFAGTTIMLTFNKYCEFLDFKMRLKHLGSDNTNANRLIRSSPHREASIFNLPTHKNLTEEVRQMLVCQKSGDLGGLPYQIYLRSDFLGEGLQSGPMVKPKLWHGNPQTVIIHATRIFGSVIQRDWIPTDVLDTLAELTRSYSMEPWHKNVAIANPTAHGQNAIDEKRRVLTWASN
ncbi:hypothetical protein AA313_de0200596 [Arthrobotrys entomopaga]|nr:hypothetical protein AA313_de0200596 [Arthrobotrys entomopaga]